MAFPNYSSPGDDGKQHQEFGVTYYFEDNKWETLHSAINLGDVVIKVPQQRQTIVSKDGYIPLEIDGTAETGSTSQISVKNATGDTFTVDKSGELSAAGGNFKVFDDGAISTSTSGATTKNNRITVAHTPNNANGNGINVSIEAGSPTGCSAYRASTNTDDEFFFKGAGAGGATNFTVKGDGSGYFAGNVGVGDSPVSTQQFRSKVSDLQTAVMGHSAQCTSANTSTSLYAYYGHTLSTQKAVGLNLNVGNSTAKIYRGIESGLNAVHNKPDSYHIYCAYEGSSCFAVKPNGDTYVRGGAVFNRNSLQSDERLKSTFTAHTITLNDFAAIETGKFDWLDPNMPNDVFGHKAQSLPDHCIELVDEPAENHNQYFDDVQVDDGEGNTITESQRNDTPIAESDKIKAVDVGALMALHTQMIQELHAENLALQARVDALENPTYP